MALEPDAVPRPVEEVLAVALAVDDVAGGSVDRLGGDPGPNGHGRGVVGREEHREEVTEILRRALAVVATRDPQRPGRVAVVATERAADVEHDWLAGLDHPIGRLVVGRRGIRPGRDDRELGQLVALGSEPIPHLGGDVHFGPSDERSRRDLVDDPIRGGPGQPQQLDLVLILDHPELAEDRVH